MTCSFSCTYPARTKYGGRCGRHVNKPSGERHSDCPPALCGFTCKETASIAGFCTNHVSKVESFVPRFGNSRPVVQKLNDEANAKRKSPYAEHDSDSDSDGEYVDDVQTADVVNIKPNGTLPPKKRPVPACDVEPMQTDDADTKRSAERESLRRKVRNLFANPKGMTHVKHNMLDTDAGKSFLNDNRDKICEILQIPINPTAIPSQPLTMDDAMIAFIRSHKEEVNKIIGSSEWRLWLGIPFEAKVQMMRKYYIEGESQKLFFEEYMKNFEKDDTIPAIVRYFILEMNRKTMMFIKSHFHGSDTQYFKKASDFQRLIMMQFNLDVIRSTVDGTSRVIDIDCHRLCVTFVKYILGNCFNPNHKSDTRIDDIVRMYFYTS
jgi:hypothetical protein